MSDDFKVIVPNEKGDWINQRGNDFETFLPIADSEKTQKFFCDNYSNGLKTNRDCWCYNFSRTELARNIQTTIAFYNSNTPESVDSTKITWTALTKQNKLREKKYVFDDKKNY